MIPALLNFDYSQGPAIPAGGREVWLSLEARVTAMRWSDILSGLALIFFGRRSLLQDRPVSL